MKRVFLAGPLAFLLIFPTVSLAAELGPPMATNKKSQFAVDLEADILSQAEVEETRSLTVNVSGLGFIQVSDLDDAYSLRRRGIALVPSYGVAGKATLYGHIGMAAFRGKDCEPVCIDSDYAPSYGAGIRATFFERGQFRFGGVAQAIHYASRDAADIVVETGGLSGRFRNVTIEGREYSLSLGAAYKADLIEPYIAINATSATYPIHYEFDWSYVLSGKTYTGSAKWDKKATRSADKAIGFQGGLSLKPMPNLRVNVGVRVLNETTLSVSGGWAF